MQVDVHISASAVAWYAAIVATASVLVSGYAVWRDRARVKVTAKGGWRVIQPGGGVPYPYDTNKNYISITVINKGRRPVTITKGGLRERRRRQWLLATDSMMHGARELAEGKSCEFMLEEAQVDVNNVAYAFVQDATGRMYKGRFKRGDAVAGKKEHD